MKKNYLPLQERAIVPENNHLYVLTLQTIDFIIKVCFYTLLEFSNRVYSFFNKSPQERLSIMPNNGTTVEYFSALWNCKYCLTKDIFARNPRNPEQRIDHCPNCGAAIPEPIDVDTRGHEGNPYRTPSEDQWTQLFDTFSAQQGEAGPDWTCESCSSLNSDLHSHCVSCGYPRKPQKEEKAVAENTRGREVTARDIPSSAEEQPPQETFPPHLSKRDAQIEQETHQREPSVSGHGYHRSKALPVMAGFTALAACVWLVWFFFFSASDVQVEVIGFSWERKIAVEDFAPRQSGAWQGSVPSDAYNERETRKVHHYNKVQTGTRVVEHQRSRRVQSGSRRECSTENRENGVIKRTCHSVPEYRTEYYTDSDTVPVYRDDPIYKTWIDYTVNRWEFSRWITASGNNHDAHWPETPIHSVGSAIPKIGDERLSERTEHYIVRLREMGSGEPRIWNETVSFSRWQKFSISEGFVIHTNRIGTILGSLEATTSSP